MTWGKPAAACRPPDNGIVLRQQGQADFVALGRELLRNPYWPLHAARTLEEDIEWPTAYQRAKISRK